MAITTTLMGPGFFIFFKTKTYHGAYNGNGPVEQALKKKRQANEIIAIIMAIYDSEDL